MLGRFRFIERSPNGLLPLTVGCGQRGPDCDALRNRRAAPGVRAKPADAAGPARAAARIEVKPRHAESRTAHTVNAVRVRGTAAPGSPPEAARSRLTQSQSLPPPHLRCAGKCRTLHALQNFMAFTTPIQPPGPSRRMGPLRTGARTSPRRGVILPQLLPVDRKPIRTKHGRMTKCPPSGRRR